MKNQSNEQVSQQSKPSARQLLRTQSYWDLLKATLITSLGLIAVFSANLIDTYFVSQLGTSELAALSLVLPIANLLLALLVGLGIGVSVVSSQQAEGKQKDQNLVLLLLSFVISAVLSVGLVFAVPWILRQMGGSESLIELGTGYLVFWLISFPFLAICMVGAAILRGQKKMAQASRIMVGIAITSSCLDPVFIFGCLSVPALGMEGAAIAALFARIGGAGYTLMILYRLHQWRRSTDLCFTRLKAAARDVAKLSLTAMFNRVQTPIAALFATALMAWHSEAAVASFGLVNAIQGFSMVLLSALANTIGPYLGAAIKQQQGAQVKQVLRYTLIFLCAWGVLNSAVQYLYAKPITGAFSRDPAIEYLAVFYMQLVPISMVGLGLMIVTNTFYYAVKKPMHSIYLTIFRSYGLFLLPCFLGLLVADIKGAFVGVFLGQCVLILICLALLKRAVLEIESTDNTRIMLTNKFVASSTCEVNPRP
ncbi:MATE family efflux transporter [Pseudoalteromonas sp. S16_S37]|uniref:MATE family efflux transporter n=1 Tax=Pseudoalteromonas sp. S16_S37 TaxID=2720228 RepID=UPI0016808D19|nr:MATE family efflux transporter [Pseudoalteromonas sp. S16_S37]MBD1580682.1 hypothetical protein [Pseudoalteromonas sp. S16_S37]